MLVAWVEELTIKVNLVLWKVAEEDACPVSALSTLKHLRFTPFFAKIKRELLFTAPRKRQIKDKKTPLIMRSAFLFYPLVAKAKKVLNRLSYDNVYSILNSFR